MDNEPYKDLTHDQAADLLRDLYRSANNEVKREFVLPNGRVADLMVLAPDRDFYIVEIKTIAKPYYLDDALNRFGHYAHRVWFGMPHLSQAQADAMKVNAGWRATRDRVGIMGIEHDALVIYRQAARRAMPIALYETLYARFCAT